MNDNVSDADLERFLRRRDPIARDYAALESEQPSAELDALVMERARAALSEESGPAQWRRRRWPAITALAATVVLSFAVITRITLDADQAGLSAPASTMSDTASPAAKAAEAPVETFAVTPPAASPQTTLEEPAPTETERTQTRLRGPTVSGQVAKQKAEAGGALARDDAGVYAQQPPEFARSERESATANALTRKDASADASSTSDESLPTLREFTERLSAERRTSDLQDENAKKVVVNGSRQALPATTDGLVAEKAARRAPVADANAPSANAPAATATDARAARQEILSAPPAVLQKTSAPPASPARVGRSRMTTEGSGTALAGSAPQAEDEPRDPMEWLQAIRALRTAGRNEEADRELAAFRQVYPQIIEVYEVDGSGKRDTAPAEAQAQPRPPTK